jgi:thioredoxin reductase (NADPH)
VILATGRQPVQLEVPTVCDQVHYCAICDGSPYKGKNVLVVGGGNSAFDESLYLLNIGIGRIHLVEVMESFAADRSIQDELFATGRVTSRTSARVADLILSDSKLAGVQVENLKTGVSETVPAEAVFVFIGQHPSNELFRDQVALSERGYVLVKEDMSTNIPGVFGAGDINEKAFRQITTAVSDGTIAALAVERFLRHK